MKDDIIDQLRFKYELNKKIIQIGFDAMMEDISFVSHLAEFEHTRIDQIWLKKSFGLAYIEWNKG